MRFAKLVLLVLLPALAGCGYRLAARKGDVGDGRTIAVPTFANATSSYRIEQRMSEAVRRELVRSTRFHVTSEPAGDVVVIGEVLGYSTSPTVFDDRGRAAQYLISLDLRVVVTESDTGAVLLQNDRMTLRDSFQLSQSSSDFVGEDPAAIARLAERFASSLVASIVHREP